MKGIKEGREDRYVQNQHKMKTIKQIYDGNEGNVREELVDILLMTYCIRQTN